METISELVQKQFMRGEKRLDQDIVINLNKAVIHISEFIGMFKNNESFRNDKEIKNLLLYLQYLEKLIPAILLKARACKLSEILCEYEKAKSFFNTHEMELSEIVDGYMLDKMMYEFFN